MLYTFLAACEILYEYFLHFEAVDTGTLQTILHAKIPGFAMQVNN